MHNTIRLYPSRASNESINSSTEAHGKLCATMRAAHQNCHQLGTAPSSLGCRQLRARSFRTAARLSDRHGRSPVYGPHDVKWRIRYVATNAPCRPAEACAPGRPARHVLRCLITATKSNRSVRFDRCYPDDVDRRPLRRRRRCPCAGSLSWGSCAVVHRRTDHLPESHLGA